MTEKISLEEELSEYNIPLSPNSIGLEEKEFFIKKGSESTNEPENVPPIPWKPLSLVFFMFVVDVLSFSSLMPYIAALVKDLNLVSPGDTKSVGYYASVIGSSYYIAQFSSAFFWGYVSDTHGRRIVLLTGIFGGFVSSLLFGFSKSLWWAMTTRLFFGLVNGNLGAYKVYISEITHKKHHPQVFSYISLSVSLGTVFGPAIGGFLSNPIDLYPTLFSHAPQQVVQLLMYFPFLLPNLVISGIQLCSFVLAYLYLEESNQSVLKTKSDGYIPLSTSEVASTNDTPSYNKVSKRIVLIEDEEQENRVDSGDGSSTLLKESQPIKQLITPTKTPPANKPQSKESFILSLKDNPLVACLLYAIIGFTNIAFAECMPLLMVLNSSSGGLDFNQKQIGILSSITGFMMILFQLFFCARIMRYYGLRNTMKYCSIILTFIVQLYPFVNRLISHPMILWSALIVLNVVRFAAIQTSFSTSNVMLNNSVLPQNRGKLNGAAQSMVALARSIAPLLGIVFALTATINSFPFNIHFIFFVLTGTHLFCYLLARSLTKEINEPKVIGAKQSTHV